jgi:hypothetical protein
MKWLRLTLSGYLVLQTLAGCSTSNYYTRDTVQTAGEVLNKAEDSPQLGALNNEEAWGKPFSNKAAQAYVEALTRRLDSSVRVQILNGSLVNGRAMAASIELTRGMLNACQNEAELFAYIGHEVGHIQGVGESERGKKSLLRDWITKGAQYIPDGTGLLSRAESEESYIHDAQYSQRREEKADEFGAELAAKAGYNPYALADLFDRLASQVTMNRVLYRLAKFKGTHKALDARAKHLRQFLADKKYPKTGELAARHYRQSLASLAPDLQEKSRATLDELAGFQREIANYQVTHQSIPIPRFLTLMKRLSEINQSTSVWTERELDGRVRIKAFMQEALFMDAPSWNGIDGSIGKALRGVLSGLGHLALGGMPEIGSAVNVFEMMTGRDFVTGQDLNLHGIGLAFVGLVALGVTGTEMAAAITEAGSAIDGGVALRGLRVGEQMVEGIEESPTLNKIFKNPDFSKTDFYVRPNGDVIPSTGYRYLAENARGIEEILETGQIPSRGATDAPNYISFNNISTNSEAKSVLQLQIKPQYKVEFNTQQISDLKIPNGNWGRADYLEPVTKDFPEFGESGAAQAITQEGFQAAKITDLITGKVIYSGS